MKLKGTVLIIHAFALAHALTAAICAWTNIPDSLLLTLLTMVMTVLLCSRKRISLQLATVTIILVNILGVVLGKTGASLLSLLPLGHAVLHSISTFITTELLGWGLVFVFRMIPHRPNDDRRTLWWERGTGWMIMVVAVVFVFRLAISVMLSTGLYGSSGLWPVFSEFLSNPLLLLLMLCANFFFLRAFKFNARQNPRTYLIVVVFVLLNAAAADLFLCFGLPQTFSTRITWEAFAGLYIVALVCEVTILSLLYLLYYAQHIRNRLDMEKEKTHQAEFRYLALKQQLNPHFLFNSLNILDSLVQEGDPERASWYIHHLASLYRYMLKHETDAVVFLSEEMEFVHAYTDLLKVRFPKGLTLTDLVPDEYLSRLIVPCSIQMLVENATKHNAFSPEEPMDIRISGSDGCILVENRLRPKLSTSPSTGFGLKFIGMQFKDLGVEPTVVNSGEKYCVKLPLL